MRTSVAYEALKLAVAAKRPVMLHGSPGVGKSDLIRKLTKELGISMIDLRLSQLDPVDLRGVPSVNGKTHTTSWNVPDFFPTDPKSRGILFLDEINSAAQATQAAAYQLVLDRCLGDYELPEGWDIVAAGNLSGDRAIVNTMSTALKNRFSHIVVETNVDDWCDWALTDNNVHTDVIAFIRFRPSLLNEFEKRGDTADERKRLAHVRDQQAFGTPRSWHSLSKIHTVAKDLGANAETAAQLYTGTVGEGCGLEFNAFVTQLRDMPSIDGIMMNPSKAPVPKDNPAIMYAVATALGSRIDDTNFADVCVYLERCPAEYRVVAVKDAITRTPQLGTTAAFTKFCTDNRLLFQGK